MLSTILIYKPFYLVRNIVISNIIYINNKQDKTDMSDNNRGSQIKEEDKLDWNKNPQLWVTKLQDTLVGDVNNNDVVRFGLIVLFVLIGCLSMK